MSDKVKVGYIGCGSIVQGHLLSGTKDFADVEFVAWCDPKEENAAARREEAGGGGEIYSDPETMLDKARPDAVFIMIPPTLHGEIDELVIDRGVPFFVEKPVAMEKGTRFIMKKDDGKMGVGVITEIAD